MLECFTSLGAARRSDLTIAYLVLSVLLLFTLSRISAFEDLAAAISIKVELLR